MFAIGDPFASVAGVYRYPNPLEHLTLILSTYVIYGCLSLVTPFLLFGALIAQWLVSLQSRPGVDRSGSGSQG